MRDLIIILAFNLLLNSFISVANCQCENNDSNDYVLYKKAYEYIIKDSAYFNKTINVSNEQIGTFYEILASKRNGGINFDELMLNLDIDEKNYNELPTELKKSQCFPKYACPDYILSFSKIEHNILFAEICYSYNFLDKIFGKYVYYYFLFDKQANIKEVISQTMYGL
jgi:hypothetical protein